VLINLPQVPLPSWAAGVSIGGPVTLQAILAAVYFGLQLAVVLFCFGAANSLASPYRLLRCLPAVFYEAGVAVTVALSFTPAAVITVRRLRAARRLRGRPVRGIAGVRGMAIPVLEGTLDQALELAASMDARGYGRHRQAAKRAGRLGDLATVVGLLALAVGLLGVLDQAAAPGLFAPIGLSVGVVSLLGGLAARGRRSVRSRYRPDRWSAPEWIVLLCAGGVAAVFAAFPAGLHPSTSPVVSPALPLAPVLALVGILAPLTVTRPYPLASPPRPVVVAVPADGAIMSRPS
jgi:energy-coupling factor transport system permease protein